MTKISYKVVSKKNYLIEVLRLNDEVLYRCVKLNRKPRRSIWQELNLDEVGNGH